jgi:hypothetical protein
MHRHISHEHHAAKIYDPASLLLERRGVSDQCKWPQVVAIQVHSDYELIGSEQMILINSDWSLNSVQDGLSFDLHRKVRAVLKPVNHSVDATVEHWQEDVQAPAGLRDEFRPDEELACLSDRILAAVGPDGIEVGHRRR